MVTIFAPQICITSSFGLNIGLLDMFLRSSIFLITVSWLDVNFFFPKNLKIQLSKLYDEPTLICSGGPHKVISMHPVSSALSQ